MNGEDVRRQPIEERKRRLAGLLRLPHDGIAGKLARYFASTRGSDRS